MVETLKKYWWAFALGLVAIYFFFFNKKGKTIRRRGRRAVKTRYKNTRRRYSSWRSNRRTRRANRRNRRNRR